MRLVCTENGANKFWEGSVDGRSLRVRFGRMGTAGQSKSKELATPEAAERELARLVAEKRRKGYRAEGGAGGEGPGIPAAMLAGKPLLDLAALLGRDQARSLIEDVELASSAPETYLARSPSASRDAGSAPCARSWLGSRSSTGCWRGD